MKTSRTLALAFVWLQLIALPAWTYHYIGRYNTASPPSGFVPARYDVSKLSNSTITFYLTNQRPSAMARGDFEEAFASEVALATSTWNNVSTSSLRVKFGGYFKQSSILAVGNPMGLVILSSSLPPGAFAVGGPIFQIPSGNPSFLPVALSRVQFPADMSQTKTSNPFFLTALVHEMGHSLGANHSHVASVMLQSNGTTRARVLTEDDVAMMSNLYPASTFSSTTGSISGRVTTSTGSGASIVGVSAFSDSLVIGALTNPDGSFTINGLPPGNYKLMVQSLPLGGAPSSSADNSGDPDDLITTRTLTNTVLSINTNVDSAFFAGGGATTRTPATAVTFPVSAGQTTTGADVTIGARGPLRLETNDTFTFPPNSTQETSLMWVRQGTSASVAVDGKKLDAAGLDISFTNSGLSFGAGSLQIATDPDPTDIFNSAALFAVQAGPTATLGSSCVIYTNGTDTYFSAGHVQVVASPPPSLTTISPTNGGAGTVATLTGSNFTSSSKVYFDGVQANITSNTPTSLVVVAPPGAAGQASTVFIANADGQGSEFLRNPPTFSYSTLPQPSVTVSPATAAPGQALSVSLTGENTNFQQGLTTIGFGSGDVIVDSFTVQSSTSLVVQIHVLQSVANAAYPVTVATGEEIVFLDNALTMKTQGPFTLVPVSGNLQASTAGTVLPRPLLVLAQDANGVPVANANITFEVASGGGSVSPSTAVTDATGLAQTQMTLGPAAGIQMVTASANQFATTGFMEAVGTTSAFSFRAASSGSGQTGTVNSDLPMPLTLTISDTVGNPLPGLPFGWVVTGGGSVRNLSGVTDSSGKISAIWTLGPTVGTQTAQALPFFYNGASPFSGGPSFSATAQAGSITPSVPGNGILNGAGFDSAVPGLSPGAIASIFGTNLSTAPAAGVLPGLVPGTSMLKTISNGTQVTFDGVLAPLFFVSPGQLNVQVPFEVSGKTSVQMVVSLNGNNSAPVTVSILPATPALFTADSSGRGPAALLNQDGTSNTASNPAAAGTVIQLFTTGLGPVSPAGVTGVLAPTSEPLARSTSVPTVTVGGLRGAVQFSGLAPGFVGLWQVNVTVPPGAGIGAVPLALTTGGQNANPVTVFLK